MRVLTGHSVTVFFSHHVVFYGLQIRYRIETACFQRFRRHRVRNERSHAEYFQRPFRVSIRVPVEIFLQAYFKLVQDTDLLLKKKKQKKKTRKNVESKHICRVTYTTNFGYLIFYGFFYRVQLVNCRTTRWRKSYRITKNCFQELRRFGRPVVAGSLICLSVLFFFCRKRAKILIKSFVWPQNHF